MDDGFPVVVVLGLAIFGVIWIGSQAETFTGTNTDSITLYSSEPGTIGETRGDFRTINFNDFTVGETRGDIQAYTTEKTTISNELLSQDKIIIDYNATQPGPGQVRFEVLGRIGQGEIYVKVNGNQVFKAATISGAEPEINISQQFFQNGMNQIIIGTSKTGLIGESTYSLEDVEVTVEDRKFHDYETYFEMYQHELENFQPSNLTFQIPVDQSIPQQPLEIEVNNQQIFSQATGRSTQQVTLTPQNADLGTGYNTIKFSTDGESKYTIQNPEIQVRYSTNTQPAQNTFQFELDQEQLNYIQRDNTQETINFDYQRTTTIEPIQITLNNENYQITPENGENTIQIDSNHLQTENELTLDSNQTFTLQNLQITSARN